METKKSGPIDWDRYASQYDLLAFNNPSYLENIDIVRSLVRSMNFPDDALVCDIGGGTGNYSLALAAELPTATFYHLDSDAEMVRIAENKFKKSGLSTAKVVHSSVFDANFPRGGFDLIVCVNALYAMTPQLDVLRKIKSWLKPSGKFIVIDFGRRTKVFDWGLFILGSMLREKGIFRSIKFFVEGFGALQQNRRGAKGQSDGSYWLHSTTEFGRALSEAGFLVSELRTCYRGYCDLAVCELG